MGRNNLTEIMAKEVARGIRKRIKAKDVLELKNMIERAVDTIYEGQPWYQRIPHKISRFYEKSCVCIIDVLTSLYRRDK